MLTIKEKKNEQEEAEQKSWEQVTMILAKQIRQQPQFGSLQTLFIWTDINDSNQA